jgi:hypothetical protein
LFDIFFYFQAQKGTLGLITLPSLASARQVSSAAMLSACAALERNGAGACKVVKGGKSCLKLLRSACRIFFQLIFRLHDGKS